MKTEILNEQQSADQTVVTSSSNKQFLDKSVEIQDAYVKTFNTLAQEFTPLCEKLNKDLVERESVIRKVQDLKKEIKALQAEKSSKSTSGKKAIDKEIKDKRNEIAKCRTKGGKIVKRINERIEHAASLSKTMAGLHITYMNVTGPAKFSKDGLLNFDTQEAQKLYSDHLARMKVVHNENSKQD